MQDNMSGGSCGSCGPQMTCKCPHHKMVPLFIILIGLTFLLQAMGTISASFTSMAWPILVILIGLMKITKGMCKCCGPKQQ